MGILLWIIFGGVAGWIASMIMGTDAQQGLVLNIVIGVFGAMLGGYLFNYFGKTGVTGFNIYSMGVAILGAVVLLTIVKFLRR